VAVLFPFGSGLSYRGGGDERDGGSGGKRSADDHVCFSGFISGRTKSKRKFLTLTQINNGACGILNEFVCLAGCRIDVHQTGFCNLCLSLLS